MTDDELRHLASQRRFVCFSVAVELSVMMDKKQWAKKPVAPLSNSISEITLQSNDTCHQMVAAGYVFPSQTFSDTYCSFISTIRSLCGWFGLSVHLQEDSEFCTEFQ